jgi:hypothetical protein
VDVCGEYGKVNDDLGISLSDERDVSGWPATRHPAYKMDTAGYLASLEEPELKLTLLTTGDINRNVSHRPVSRWLFYWTALIPNPSGTTMLNQITLANLELNLIACRSSKIQNFALVYTDYKLPQQSL